MSKKKQSVFQYSELQEMQSWSLDEKVEKAKEIIRETFKQGKKVALAFSGGKDSTALWHLIRTTCPEQDKNMVVIFGNTGVEYPESLNFARKIGKNWGGDNFYETKLDRTKVPRLKYEAQKEVLSLIEEQYGFPILGKDATKLDAPRININVFLKHSLEQSKGNDRYYEMLRKFPDMRISHSCCNFIKERPSQKIQKKLGCDTLFRGLLASESRRRTFTFLDYGFLYNTAKNYLYSNPLSIWTDVDVWAYIHKFNVPYAPLYDLTDEGGKKLFERNGCYVCGTGLAYERNNIEILRKYYPQKWTALMKYGMAREMKTFACAISDDIKLNALPHDWLLDMRPCAFDRLTPRKNLLEDLQYGTLLF